MKAQLYSLKGEKKSHVDLPKLFSMRVREDIAQKYFEVDEFIQPFTPKYRAGLRQSASGTISHQRHDWKGHYGRGISRIPRKTMSRRGTQFFWVGANIPGTRGGRRAHPPKGIGVEKKLNKKEMQLALNSAFAATAHKELVLKRYATINTVNEVPFVIESIPAKTKDFVAALNIILSDFKTVAFKKREVRAGKGKTRGRKYKSNAGVLVVVGNDEKTNFAGFDVKHMREVTIADLYPLGRLTVYTQKALQMFNDSKQETEAKK